MNRKILDFILLLIFLPFPGAAWALSTDKDQPINVEADTLDIDNKEGVSVYKGNVIVTQGSMRLNGDTVTLYRLEEGLQKVVAEGNPARFRQRPDSGEEDLQAQARRMEYYARPEKLVLLEGAHVWQGNNEVSGNRIEYDVVRDVATASKGPKERVKAVIQPQKKPGPAGAPSTPASPPAKP